MRCMQHRLYSCGADPTAAASLMHRDHSMWQYMEPCPAPDLLFCPESCTEACTCAWQELEKGIRWGPGLQPGRPTSSSLLNLSDHEHRDRGLTRS